MDEVAFVYWLLANMKIKKHSYYFICAIASAVLMVISWQPFSFFVASFFGFIPLFFLENRIRKEKDHSGVFFFYLSLSLFLWNAGATFWIWNATAFGAIAAFVVNMIMMSLPFMVYHRMQKRIEESRAEWIFIFSWIAFEFWHLNWDLSWPWLTLGNVFSTVPSIVQWYEYTGVFGGTFWILYVNIRLFKYFKTFNERSRIMNFSKAFNVLFFTIFAPIFLSFYLQANYHETAHPYSVLVVQPNIDPYKDKFGSMTPLEQTQKMLNIAESKIDSSIQLIIFPETAVIGSLDENRLESNESIQLIRKFIQKHAGVKILTGADTYKFYADASKKTATARKYEGSEYYDVFNTAFFIDASSSIQIYHKAKLVPGVEKMPFPQLLRFLESLAVKLGGTSGSLGSSEEAENFSIEHHQFVAPVICYESIYGEYVTDYVRKNANLICVITNDGWWGNTPGIHQHFDYSRLRAIETRRFVARAANTGISGFINSQGDVLSYSEWWKEDALKMSVNLNSNLTFYTEHGDYIAKLATILALLAIVFNWRKPMYED